MSGQRSIRGFRRAMTVVELLIVVAVMGAVIALATPAVLRYIEDTKVLKVIGDIRAIEAQVLSFESEMGFLPDELEEVIEPVPTDAWGKEYEYLPFQGAGWKGQVRKDRFLKPLNSTFDLYSMGPDGESRPALTAGRSHDDIIRANDGSFIGRASEF